MRMARFELAVAGALALPGVRVCVQIAATPGCGLRIGAQGADP